MIGSGRDSISWRGGRGGERVSSFFNYNYLILGFGDVALCIFFRFKVLPNNVEAGELIYDKSDKVGKSFLR